MSNKKTVSPDVKKQILDRIKNHGVPIAQAAQEHGLSNRTIYGWLAKGLIHQPSWAEVVRLKRENQDLMAIIGKLTVDLTTVKKRASERS